jgi:hypothetical protein
MIKTLASCHVYAEEKPIGLITFFGQEGFDTSSIRTELPFHEGSLISVGENVADEQLVNR